MREGIHERIQAEIHQGKQGEGSQGGAKEMLEVPPEWIEVLVLMMEEEDVLPKATGSTKQRRDEMSPEGGENGRRKMTSCLRNVDIRPQYLGEYKIQRDSILKIGMKFSRKKTNGKDQISGREYHRWCFMTEV